jgi:hypothetical protein
LIQQSTTQKDPIRNAPLREPGQSLRESLDELRFEDVAAWICLAIFSGLAAIDEWLRWWFDFPPHPLVITLVAISVAILALFRIRAAGATARALKLGLKGERSTGQLLQSELLPLGYHVFHDCLFEESNVDHVAIGPGGVFAIETKTWSKPRGNARVYFDGKHVTMDGMSPDRDPIVQAKAGAASISRVLREFTGRSPFVRPAVVFPGWYVEGKSSGAEVWVLNPDAFLAFVKKEPVQLSSEDIQFFAAGLARYIRSTL